MGLDYIIQYWKGKENVAANALSRCYEEESSAAIIEVVPQWYREVIDIYQGDEKLKPLLEELAVGTHVENVYTLSKGMLRFQGRIVIRNKMDLKRKIFQALTRVAHGGAFRGAKHVLEGEVDFLLAKNEIRN